MLTAKDFQESIRYAEMFSGGEIEQLAAKQLVIIQAIRDILEGREKDAN